MICPRCLTENRDAAKFCNECGYDLRSDAANVRNEAGADMPSARADGAADANAPASDNPAQVISHALDEVRLLRDTVPPIVKVPAVIPPEADAAQAPSDAAAADPASPADPRKPAQAGKDTLDEDAARDDAPDAPLDNPPTSLPAIPSESVMEEARALFGERFPAAGTDPGAEVTADLTGLERLVDSSYVPPTYPSRSGSTMELPRIADEQAGASQAYVAQIDKKELRRQRKAQRALEREQAKREKELRRQGTVEVPENAPASESAQDSEREKPAAKAPVASASTSAEREQPGQDKEPSPRRFAKLPLLIAAAAVVVACAAAGVTYGMELWGGKTIPDVAGMSQIDAQTVLEEKGFSVQFADMKSDELEGLALATEPGAGTRAESGSTITVDISVARVVPSVVGLSSAEAEALFADEGLASVQYTPVKSNEAEGTVLAVTPAAGERVKSTDAISVEVAQPFTVPDVAGKTTEEAVDTLEAEGYVVTTIWYNTEELPEGTAVSTDPAAGTKLNSGEAVTLSVAHNRSTELISLTRSFFTDSPLLVIDGVNYEMSEVSAVSYAGNNTCTFTIVARPYETHTWMFGLGSETRYGNYETISGSISWDDANNIVATTPAMKQGANA